MGCGTFAKMYNIYIRKINGSLIVRINHLNTSYCFLDGLNSAMKYSRVSLSRLCLSRITIYLDASENLVPVLTGNSLNR